MRYSIEPKERVYVKGYGVFSFAKNMGKSLSNKYGQKIIDNAKKCTSDALKTALKREINKTAEASGDLTGNKIADKITSASRKSNNGPKDKDIEITTHKKDTYLQKKGKKILIDFD